MNDVFRALSDPTRRQVLEILKKGPLSAGSISDHFQVSKPTISAHLSILQDAGLVSAERVGRSIIYRLKLSVLEDALLGFVRLVTPGTQTGPETRTNRVKQNAKTKAVNT